MTAFKINEVVNGKTTFNISTLKVGDKVRITKSDYNWIYRMDPYVGQVVKVIDVVTSHKGETHIRFNDDGGHFWVYEHGHFVMVEQEKFTTSSCSGCTGCSEVYTLPFGRHTVVLDCDGKVVSVDGGVYTFPFRDFASILSNFPFSDDDQWVTTDSSLGDFDFMVQPDTKGLVSIGCMEGTYEEAEKILSIISDYIS
jgi:hypothetical protein